MASKNNKKASAKVYLQVLGTDSVDTTPSLLLFTDTQRYVFNCGEGTQRLFNEHKVKLGKLCNIFFTQICWKYVGGLPGMAMTLRDNGRCNLGLYGPGNIKEFVKATRFFLFHENLHFECIEYSGKKEEKYVDENLSVIPVVLQAEAVKTKHGAAEHAICSTELSADNTHELNPTKKIKLDIYTRCRSVVCYICGLSSLPGKFLVSKAKELGVPKGPLYGKLKNGEVVVLNCGKKVLPEEVTEPSTPGPVFIIIDCPSTGYIHSLAHAEPFASYHVGRVEGGTAPCLIVHLTPMEVFNDPLYQSWRERFGGTTEHLLINKDVCSRPLVFQSQAAIQYKLHTLDKAIFPLLYQSNSPTFPLADLPPHTTPGEHYLQFHLGPVKQQGYDRTNIPEKLDIDSITKDAEAIVASSQIDEYSRRATSEFEQQGYDRTNITGKFDIDSIAEDAEAIVASSQIDEYGRRATSSEFEQQVYDRTNIPGKLDVDSITEDAEAIVYSSQTDKHSRQATPDEFETDLLVGEESCTGQSFIVEKRDSQNISLSKEQLSRKEHLLDESETETANLESNPKNIEQWPAISEISSVGGEVKASSCSDSNEGKHDFEVVFVGTGASIPSKCRNVSSTLVNISDSSAVLLDCGEGTLGQLYRHYGNDTDHAINRISCVFISHIHADHHLGLTRVLLHKANLSPVSPSPPVLVIGPTKVHLWLQEYSALCEELHYRFLDCASIVSEHHELEHVLRAMEAQQVLAVPVDHCAHAYGLVLKHVSGWKIVYSGDTRPCPRLVQAGAGATLLIHEATFEDDLQEEAIDKKHSTTTEAISSGLGMRAQFIMLNHFSQRYPKLPVFGEQFTKHTGIAFDHMTVHPRDFNRIPSLLGPLKLLFADEIEELSKRTKADKTDS